MIYSIIYKTDTTSLLSFNSILKQKDMVICTQWNLKDKIKGGETRPQNKQKGMIIMDKHRLGVYDLRLLEEARKNILKVYEYHYGDSYMRKEIKRLETIISKIETLQNLK